MAIETLKLSLSDSNDIVDASSSNKVVWPRSPHKDLNKVFAACHDFHGHRFIPFACFSVPKVLINCTIPLVSLQKANMAVDLNGESLQVRQELECL